LGVIYSFEEFEPVDPDDVLDVEFDAEFEAELEVELEVELDGFVVVLVPLVLVDVLPCLDPDTSNWIGL
jgi:hypothetical protein